jgi:hypothetical protein
MINQDDAFKAAQNMERMGGGFEKAIAVAFFRADGDNSRRLREAFPHIFEKNFRLWTEDQEQRAKA